VAELDVALLEQLLRIGEETPITLYVRGISRRDLRVEPGLVVDVVEDVPVFPAQAVEGVDADQLDLVRSPTAHREAETAKAHRG